MADRQSGYPKPNYTQIPNILLDEHLPEMSKVELKIVLSIARKTLGWHKDRDRLSLTQLQKITGMSRQSVITGTEEALKRGIIGRKEIRNTFEYWLIVQKLDQSEKEIVQNLDQASPKNRPIPSENGLKNRHTKERVKNKETQEKEITYVAVGKEFDEPKQKKNPKGKHKAMVKALAEVCEVNATIKSNWSWLGKTAKELIEAGHTPVEIIEKFGADGPWYKKDWRGQKGQKPNPSVILQSIKQLEKKDYVSGEFAEYIEH